jgi:hypothetical protein
MKDFKFLKKSNGLFNSISFQKTQIIYFNSYYSFLCIFIFISACKDDCKNYKPRDVYNSINEDNFKRVTYSGYDTIIFLRNNIDTISFYGTGKMKIVTLENGNLGGCGPATIEHNDNFKLNFISNQINDKVEIEIRYPNYLDFFFKEKRFSSHLGELRDPFDLQEIVINNRIYKDIILIYGSSRDTIFYNIEFGIVKIGFISGEQFSLIEKN